MECLDACFVACWKNSTDLSILWGEIISKIFSAWIRLWTTTVPHFAVAAFDAGHCLRVWELSCLDVQAPGTPGVPPPSVVAPPRAVLLTHLHLQAEFRRALTSSHCMSGFLHLGPIDVLGSVTFVAGACLVPCRMFSSVLVSSSRAVPFVTTKNVFRHFRIPPEGQTNNSPASGWEPLLYILSLSNPTNTLGFSYDLHVNCARYITSVQTLCLSSSDNMSFWIFQRDCKAGNTKCYSSHHISSLGVSCLMISSTIHPSPSCPVSS